MATADPIVPAILHYIGSGAYPESETVASTTIDSTSLTNLLAELRAAQDTVKNDIRTLSKSTAPDIDTWITKANALQTDILRSRDTARAIVAQHEAGKELKAAVEDAGSKVRLLEKEVGFEEALSATLEQIQYANRVLDGVRDHAVKGDVTAALDRLETAQESIDGLEGVKETRACGLLYDRVQKLKDDLAETATSAWNSLIAISLESRRIAITKGGANSTTTEGFNIDLDALVKAAQRLNIFEGLVQKLGKDVERTVSRPRLMTDEDGHVAKVTSNDAELSCIETSNDISHSSLFHDLDSIVDFLNTHLPTSIAVPLSSALVPALSTRLEEYWLEPAVPIDITRMAEFQNTLNNVQNLANHIDTCGWHGSKHLHDWAANAPRNWLTKRRETVLGDVRNLVFAGLKKTEVVERVETQMVSKDDHEALGGGTGGDADDWDTDWAEPEDETAVDEKQPAGAPLAGDEDEEEEGDAWGWGDGDEEEEASSPVAATSQSHPTPAVNGTAGTAPVVATKAAERAITLRESFTVTAIPTGILTILQTIISDAETLAKPEYSAATSTSSAIAPAVARALYTLPTLALAIYRATAPTAYNGANAGGNMLLYNDASYLASLLRSWQSSPSSSQITQQLRLDSDLKALDLFAKRAYSAEMESQRIILHDLLSSTNGFSNVNTPPFKGESENAIEETVHRLREVHRQWKTVLSDGALLQSLGALLAGVMTQIIADVEELGDIGAEESHQLRTLMDKVSSVRDLFTKQQQGGEGQDMTFVYCPNWLKFQYLAEILESSLADIRFLWSEGELALEFEREEVIELITGLFAESDMRRRAIGEIRRSGRG